MADRADAVESEASGEASQLPLLREDLRLHSGGRKSDWAPTWIMQDPASGSYFHIGWQEFEILSRWHLADANRIVLAVNRSTTLTIDTTDVDAVAEFMVASGLVRLSSAALKKRLDETRAQRKWNFGRLLSEKLLFRRFPLFRPQAFLERTYPFVRPLFSRTFRYATAIAFVFAIYLVSRQWSSFTASLSEAFTFEGIVGVTILLAISKSIHELAHAYSAVRHGARVPVMGVAFLIFWPVLYTDTSDAWTIADRKKRLGIAIAGVTAEAAIAVGALLLWSFLEPGALRNTAAFGATTLLALSLAFNMNPFMKFDGYFVLCELLGTDNAQNRAIALLQWWLRKNLVGVALACPESNPSRSLLLYGLGTVLYRVVLYGGIAVALNLLLFPLLAIPMSAALILTFLIIPAFKEFAMWFKFANQTGGIVRQMRVLAIITILVAPLFVPWRTTVSFPVVYKAGDAFQIFAPEPGQLMEWDIKQGQKVVEGQPLFRLVAPELTSKLQTTELKVQTLDRIIDQQLTGDQYREQFLVRESELAKARTELAGFRSRENRLTVRAPADGLVTFVEDGLTRGLWVSSDRMLMQVVKPRAPMAIGYIDERDLSSIKVNSAGIIWFDGVPDSSIPVEITEIFPEAVQKLDEPVMSADQGGPIATRRGKDNELIPERGVYKINMTTVPEEGAKLPFRKTRGYARIETPPRNIISRIYDRIVGLWRREFG